MNIGEILLKDEQFRYMLLSRMKSDCLYYINNNVRENVLWALNWNSHIIFMKQIYLSLPIKPEWLTYDDINQLKIKMEKKSCLENMEKLVI